jgi:hypothetical protein
MHLKLFSLVQYFNIDRGTLAEVVDQLHDFFKCHRYVGEFIYVEVCMSNSRSHQRAFIREKLPNTVPITLENKEKPKDEASDDTLDDGHHYKVQLLNYPNVQYIVNPSQIKRDKNVLAKPIFKKYVKEVAVKGKWAGSPWIVHVFRI